MEDPFPRASFNRRLPAGAGISPPSAQGVQIDVKVRTIDAAAPRHHRCRWAFAADRRCRRPGCGRWPENVADVGKAKVAAVSAGSLAEKLAATAGDQKKGVLHELRTGKKTAVIKAIFPVSKPAEILGGNCWEED